MKTVILLLLSILIYLPSLQAAEDLPKFREVSPSIYRTGRPTRDGLAKLKAEYGLKTIINLEDAASKVKKETAWAKELGIDHLSFPTDSFSRPKDEAVAQILELLNDQTRYPILIHCKHGEDRTGMMVGLHRVFNEGWDAKVAYQEMLDLGFHKILVALDRYYKEKTGLKRQQWSLSQPIVFIEP